MVCSVVLKSGPFENGFTSGMACTVDKGACVAGGDIDLCASFLDLDCGAENVKSYMLMDSCGGHANTYHNHYDLGCDYDKSVTSAHSPLIGFILFINLRNCIGWTRDLRCL
jgi:hypothetical protein